MKNEIAYFYHLYPEQIKKKGNTYIFSYQSKKYTFTPYTRSLEEIEDLFLLNRSLVSQNIFFPKILQNIMNQALTFLNGKYYIMKEEILPEEKLQFTEVAYQMNYHFPFDKLKNIRRNNWPALWENKIDYFEYQREHIYQKFPKLSEGLDYFIGLTENAIAYIRMIESNFLKTTKDSLTFTRRRVRVSDTLSDFYNPTSLVIDHKVRDIAEFLKSCFFETDLSESEMEKYIKQLDLSDYGWGLFFGRMLFPSYFFDVYEKIINDKENEDRIIPILQKIDAYKDFLSSIQIFISQYHSIPKIQWLQKKEVL